MFRKWIKKKIPSIPFANSPVGSISACFLLLSLFLKPFYLLPSGSFQLGDLCLMASFLFAVAHCRLDFKLSRLDLSLLAFVGCVVVINLSYYIVYGSLEFILKASYYVFNFIAVILARAAFTEQYMPALVKTFHAVILVQMIVLLLDAGRYYYGSRYTGTFNDPNQMAFYVFMCLLAMKVIGCKFGIKSSPIYDLFCLVLVFWSSSTGMLLGMAVLYLILFFKLLAGGRRRRWVLLPVLFVVLLGLTTAVDVRDVDLPKTGIGEVDFAIARAEEKAQNFFSEDDLDGQSFLVDRNLEVVFSCPERMLWGAGEGAFDRFGAGNEGEIHSTILSILYYYGVIPFSILGWWVASNMRRSNGVAWLYLPILIECLTLLNQRQPLLWMLIVLASTAAQTRSVSDEKVS